VSRVEENKNIEQHQLVHRVDDKAIIKGMSRHTVAMPGRKTGGVNVVHAGWLVGGLDLVMAEI